MAGMLAELEFDAEAMRNALRSGFLNATELADYLAARGVPFRQAHHITGVAVAFAEKAGKGLEDLTLGELRGFSELIGEDVFSVLGHDAAVARLTWY